MVLPRPNKDVFTLWAERRIQEAYLKGKIKKAAERRDKAFYDYLKRGFRVI